MHVLDSTSASSRLVSGGGWLEAVLPPQIVCLLIQTTGDSGLRSGLKIKTVGLCPRPHAPTGSGESSTYSCGAVLLSFKKLMTSFKFFLSLCLSTSVSGVRFFNGAASSGVTLVRKVDDQIFLPKQTDDLFCRHSFFLTVPVHSLLPVHSL